MSDITPHKEAVSTYLTDMLEESKVESTDGLDPQELQDAIIKAHSITPTQNWRSKPFEALIFDVQGLQLAIPLHELDAVYNYPDKKLPKLPGKPTWYKGLFTHQQFHTQVIDTAQVIMPEGYKHENLPPKYIIVIDNHKWGLNCNGIVKVTQLDPEHISWRNNLGKRPWLAGTILSQMCSILNIEMLSKHLE